MARDFLVPIDLNGLELLNHRLQQLGADPGGPTDGVIWFRTDLDAVRVKTAAGVISLGAGFTQEQIEDLVSAMATEGFGVDIVYADGPGTLTFAVVDSPLLQGQNSAFHLARVNHTGTQVASTISDLAAVVQAFRLDQFAAPTAPVPFNGQRITGLADPSAAQDAATKAYVDATKQGLDPKASVRAATAAALPANTRVGNVLTADANGALPAQDGVSLAAAERLLVKDEAAGLKNGIYIVTDLGSAGTPWILTRADDADISAEVTAGMYMWVAEGTLNAETGWVLATNDPIVLNTTALTFIQFNGAGGITAGAGVTKTGNTLDVGAGAGISVGADTVSIDTAVVARKFSADVGDAAATQIDVTHSLGTRDINVSVRETASPWAQVECDTEMLDTNNVRLRFAVAPSAAQFRVTVIG